MRRTTRGDWWWGGRNGGRTSRQGDGNVIGERAVVVNGGRKFLCQLPVLIDDELYVMSAR